MITWWHLFLTNPAVFFLSILFSIFLIVGYVVIKDMF